MALLFVVGNARWNPLGPLRHTERNQFLRCVVFSSELRNNHIDRNSGDNKGNMLSRTGCKLWGSVWMLQSHEPEGDPKREW